MKKRLPEWAILGGGTAVAAAAFFASAGTTHWVMDLHQTHVVVRPGPTVYVTKPAGQSHTHQPTQPAPAAAGPAHGGSDPARLTARPDHGEPSAARQDHGEKRPPGQDLSLNPPRK
jgi:hypothetical protein